MPSSITRTTPSPSTTTTNRTDAPTRTDSARSTTRTGADPQNTFDRQRDVSASTTAPAPTRTGVTRELPSTPPASQAPASDALQAHVAGGDMLRRGAEGTEVNQLQTLLNQSGANLAVDGDFGPRTQAAVRDFQSANNLTVDGVVGPQTMEALLGQTNGTQGPATTQPRPVDRPNPTRPTPATNGDFATEPGRVTSSFGGDRATREQQAEDILRANGQWPPEDGRAYAIQIDQDNPPASASRADRSEYLRNYTGQTAVFRAENGRLVEQESPMRSASHPGQFSSGLSPDVTGDGRGDVAHIRPGVYNYTTRSHTGNGKRRLNPLDDGEFRQSARDTNQDGVIDGNEANRRHAATAIQIHEGNANSPSSIGCQTMPPRDFTRFLNGVRAADTGGNNQFTYILVRRPNDEFGANPY